jgi:hypothetical protein
VDAEQIVISLKRGDVCCACGADLPSGFRACWDPWLRTITCLECAGPIDLEQAVRVHARRA